METATAFGHHRRPAHAMTVLEPMITEAPRPTGDAVTCATCRASCCRLEVMLVTDTGVPERFVAYDRWGGMTMARLEDGWCAALDRGTMRCTIYDRRPLICREFEMGGHECLVERG